METLSSPPTWAPKNTLLPPPTKTWRRLSEAHTHSHTLTLPLWTHTLVVETNLREKSVKKKQKKGNRTPSSPQRWTRRSRGVNCFSSQQHCSGDFNGQTIYLYLFIHILFIGCADWSTEWLIVGLLTVQDASALWAAVAGREFMKTMLFILVTIHVLRMNLLSKKCWK